jgi:hypothetical protein
LVVKRLVPPSVVVEVEVFAEWILLVVQDWGTTIDKMIATKVLKAAEKDS